jgi:hypothetical protein
LIFFSSFLPTYSDFDIQRLLWLGQMAYTIEKRALLILKTRFPESAVGPYQYLDPHKKMKMICAAPPRLVVKILFMLLPAETGFFGRFKTHY